MIINCTLQGVSGNMSVLEQADGSYKVCAPNSFGYTFTTEAHPFPAGVLGCCYPKQEVEEKLLDKMFAQHIADRAPNVYLDPLFETLFALYDTSRGTVFLPPLPPTTIPLNACSGVYRFLIKTVK